MSPTTNAIIHTLAFYDAVGKIPLTNVELYKYLINPVRSSLPETYTESSIRTSNGVNTKNLPPASFRSFLKLLDDEWQELNPYIARYRGYYFLKNNNNAYERRIGIGKTSIKKWRIAQNMSKLISLLPYVRMVAVTGSLAHNATNKDSDIDILISAKGEHIWTTRVLVSTLMHILGRRRYGIKIRDRICLNHYIADTDLSLRPRHLFSAHICSSFIPLWSKYKTDKTFIEKNKGWIKAYLIQPRREFSYLKIISPRPGFLYKAVQIFEYLLTKTIAQRLESLLKRLQLNKIRNNIGKKQASEPASPSKQGPALYGAGQGEQDIIFNDQALVFHHPRPQNQKALFLYKENLRHLGCL